MIRLTLEMKEDVYEQLRKGIGIGFLKFSLEDLKSYNIKIRDIRHCEDSND